MFKVFKTSGIESNYSISSNPIFNCDPWSVYPAKHKVTKKQCSIFKFDKKKFETALTRQGLVTKSNKSFIFEDCYKILRAYVSNLIKFKHPSILQVLEPLEDHKSRAMFVTEYVFNNLSTIGKQELDEIIITKGLLQIANGVKFLQESTHSVHLNIQPSTIFINENFDWKLSGFNFMRQVDEVNNSEFFLDTFDPRMPEFLSLDYRFSSPDLILNHRLDYYDDLFSIGCLIYYLFNSKSEYGSANYLLNCESNNLSEYGRDAKKLDRILELANNAPAFKNIPENYLSPLLSLLNYKHKPWDINQFISSRIFNNDLIRILNLFDELPTMELQEKINFLSKLKNYLLKFPKNLLVNKFLSVLADILVSYTKDKKIDSEEELLISLTLENMLIISKTLSQLTFLEKVFKNLNYIVASNNLISCKLIIMNNLKSIQSSLKIKDTDSLIENKHAESFSKFLLTLFEKSFKDNANDQQSLMLQEKILLNLEVVVTFQTYSTISSVIFPKICDIFSKTTSLRIKNLTIQSFFLLLTNKNESLDNFIIVEKLLPIIGKTSSKNFKNSEFLTNLVKLYEAIFDKMSLSAFQVVSKDSTNLDIITEQIFFHLWRMLKFINNTKNFNFLVTILNKIEKFLIEKSGEAVSKVEKADVNNNLSVIPSITSSWNPTAEHNDDEDFGDFDNVIGSTQINNNSFSSPPLRSSNLSPANFQQKSSTHKIEPLSLQSSASGLSFGSTNTHNTTNLVSNLSLNNNNSVLRPTARNEFATNTTNTTNMGNNFSNNGIDWSVETNKKQSMNHLLNQKAQSSVMTPLSTPSNFPPGFSASIIQPVAKPRVNNNFQNNINNNKNNKNAFDFGDSLI
ncbi:hypothetical protein PACTADRAFT_47518 [Pachysolen tannophilus NRRL Y-2460]|uniref:Protein kinase domain-containing protein n=1 Tax=Pachysolen tannophilus NRRL Y-2460 TaxID=669874 RepID=A0A1E4U0X7_PACTA|nr:hypothetical protein PACTADRAFT_47518 [Pachysolen tannophilus NRRL Y-2460]